MSGYSQKLYRRVKTPELVHEAFTTQISGWLGKAKSLASQGGPPEAPGSETAVLGKKFLRRWFCCMEGVLLYYISPQEFPLYPKGCIPITKCSILKHAMCIEVYHPCFEPFLLYPESSLDLDRWYHALQSAANSSKEGTSRVDDLNNKIRALENECISLQTALEAEWNTARLSHITASEVLEQTFSDRTSTNHEMEIASLRSLCESLRVETQRAAAALNSMSSTREQDSGRIFRAESESSQLIRKNGELVAQVASLQKTLQAKQQDLIACKEQFEICMAEQSKQQHIGSNKDFLNRLKKVGASIDRS
mmetsp:Transcript_30437/g.49219  ORF Transcript_30437/g.49219 Transcript_30437/m.49219 type:complete len:307 (+) Transcript_30437:132-1052(+)|eukprot:CAMPEP_0184654254 /NCGR_PEP_ID=MMETSP0308-20130426/11957_1 /TAXON_ID=38269 /ORGANISM="Gloeochaete witrockiana, Strain SAG 46.84" /LENGTH=306 /DNA_ID=CAMNT_0027090167 /DNA_START=121 /DNA_END=1041 /DNA_ORIENTATION=+